MILGGRVGLDVKGWGGGLTQGEWWNMTLVSYHILLTVILLDD
jgi:hypothetical protein